MPQYLSSLNASSIAMSVWWQRDDWTRHYTGHDWKPACSASSAEQHGDAEAAWWPPNGWTGDDTGNDWKAAGSASSAEQRGDAEQHQRRVEELEEKVHDLERTVERLEQQVNYLSCQVEQMRTAPPANDQLRLCDTPGCNRRYPPDYDGYFHKHCCRHCKEAPGTHGRRCDRRCI